MPAGNLWVHDGEDKVDLGLFVKHARKGMCVPDYVQAQPDNDGWVYSQALVGIIEQYRVSILTQSPPPPLPPCVLYHPLLDRVFVISAINHDTCLHCLLYLVHAV